LIIKKKIIKIFENKKLIYNPAKWYNYTLIRFLETCSGKKIFFKMFTFLNKNLTQIEITRCLMWTQKLKNFQKTLGKGLDIFESVQLIHIALKLKDPFLLMNWLRETLYKISFWKQRLLFHFLRYLFRYFFWGIFSELKIKGLKFKLKGKISVAGNARTRTIVYTIGKTSYSTYENKILYANDLIRTFTGVMGLQLWLIF
jgi:hypothetical protein